MSTSISGTGGITFNDASVQNTAATGFGFKNRIINGAMMVAQRGTSFSSDATYPVDRFLINYNGSATFTAAQLSASPPAGFVYYLGCTIGTGSAAGSTTRAAYIHTIEGYNIADFGWGTANAKPITLSFWVQSSKTGQFGGAIQNYAQTRSYPFTYTISSANTWTQISITVAGDTSGTWNTNNSGGITLQFDLGMGSTLLGTAGAWAGADYRGATGDTSIVSTSGATWYITGVQLEKGSTATSFDYRSYGTELALCQRYCQVYSSAALGINITSTYAGTLPLKVTMRATPTLSNASFPSGGGTVVLQGETRQDVLIVYNSSSSWGAASSYVVTLSGIVSAEL